MRKKKFTPKWKKWFKLKQQKRFPKKRNKSARTTFEERQQDFQRLPLRPPWRPLMKQLIATAGGGQKYGPYEDWEVSSCLSKVT